MDNWCILIIRSQKPTFEMNDFQKVAWSRDDPQLFGFA